jgi:Histidine kinase
MNKEESLTQPGTSTRDWDAVYWACQILGWGGYSAFSLSLAVQADGWRPALIVVYALYPLYSIGLTHLLRRWIRRWRELSTPPWTTFAKLLLAILAAGLVQTLLICIVDLSMEGRNTLFYTNRSIMYTALGTTSAMGMWVVLYYLLGSNRQHREQRILLQSALREAELSALETQISPHFLFNCLSSIRSLVPGNPARAQDMIMRLSNIARYNLHCEPGHTVPLATELEVAEDYLALESVRLEHTLRLRLAISPGVGSKPVPSMILQALMENLLKHAIAPLRSGGDLLIRADSESDATRIEVEYSGGPAPGQASAGLGDVRERLRLLYGDRASLQLRSREGGSAIITVLIPANASA